MERYYRPEIETAPREEILKIQPDYRLAIDAINRIQNQETE